MERETAGGQKLTLNLCISYSSRGEIARAARLLAEEVLNPIRADAGLAHLSGLRNLRWLWLDGTGVTAKGVIPHAAMSKRFSNV